jgi:hypothetical protein
MALREYMPCTQDKLSGDTILMLNVKSNYLFDGSERKICIHDYLYSSTEQNRYVSKKNRMPSIMVLLKTEKVQ